MEATHEKIGLLFVHGMGEQKRWDHLTSAVLELAELLRQSGEEPIVSVTDRTGDWDFPIGAAHPDGLAPVTLSYTFTDRAAPGSRRSGGTSFTNVSKPSGRIWAPAPG
jgi:hypothetical protein